MTETLEQRQEKALEHFNRAVSIHLEPPSAETLAAVRAAEEEAARLEEEARRKNEKPLAVLPEPDERLIHHITL